MSGFTYNPAIPAAPNDPADDQPIMQQNYASIQNLISTDHVAFNNASAGQHTQVTFNTILPFPPPTITGSTVSRLYTQQGKVSSDPQIYFYNKNNSFLLNCVKSFGVFNTVGSSGIVSALNSYNVASITATAGTTSTYAISFPPGTISGVNAIALINVSYVGFTGNTTATAFNYAFTANTLTITIKGTTGVVSQVSFAVLQA